MGLSQWMQKANLQVARSWVGRHFRLEGSGHVCRVFLFALCMSQKQHAIYKTLANARDSPRNAKEASFSRKSVPD